MNNQGMRVSLPILPISAGALFELVSARIPGLLYAEAGGVMAIWCGEHATHNLSWVLSYKALDERSVTSELLIFPAGRSAAVKLLVLLAWLFPTAQSSLQYLVECVGAGEYLANDEWPDNGATKQLPPVTDPTDQRILAWVVDDPDLTDSDIGQRLGISRQSANNRRRRLEEMGYTVR